MIVVFNGFPIPIFWPEFTSQFVSSLLNLAFLLVQFTSLSVQMNVNLLFSSNCNLRFTKHQIPSFVWSHVFFEDIRLGPEYRYRSVSTKQWTSVTCRKHKKHQYWERSLKLGPKHMEENFTGMTTPQQSGRIILAIDSCETAI